MQEALAAAFRAFPAEVRSLPGLHCPPIRPSAWFCRRGGVMERPGSGWSRVLFFLQLPWSRGEGHSSSPCCILTHTTPVAPQSYSLQAFRNAFSVVLKHVVYLPSVNVVALVPLAGGLKQVGASHRVSPRHLPRCPSHRLPHSHFVSPHHPSPR